MAMAHHRLGHAEEARRWLGGAEKAMNKLLADPRRTRSSRRSVREQLAKPARRRARIGTEANALITGHDRSEGPCRGQWRWPVPTSGFASGSKAVVAYDRAIERQPADPRLRLERAECLHLTSPG